MEIKMQSKVVCEEKKGKLLGITFDNNITVEEHSKMCKQTGNKLDVLARIAHFLNERKRKILNLTTALLFGCIVIISQTT